MKRIPETTCRKKGGPDRRPGGRMIGWNEKSFGMGKYASFPARRDARAFPPGLKPMARRIASTPLPSPAAETRLFAPAPPAPQLVENVRFARLLSLHFERK